MRTEHTFCGKKCRQTLTNNLNLHNFLLITESGSLSYWTQHAKFYKWGKFHALIIFWKLLQLSSWTKIKLYMEIYDIQATKINALFVYIYSQLLDPWVFYEVFCVPFLYLCNTFLDGQIELLVSTVKPRIYVTHCWSLRCIWSIACRRCYNHIFTLDLTPGFNGFGKDNCKTRRETFKFWDLMRLILEDLR